jgi:hypothetical protein
LRLFENRILIIIFGSKREEVAGSWIRLHKLYASPNIRIGHVARMGEMRNAYKILVRKP